jgi:hypothetical protein
LRIRAFGCTFGIEMTTPRPALPYFTARCYACDAPAAGVRDRRPEGGDTESACARHRDTTIRGFAACIYCSGPRPSRMFDGEFAHVTCHTEACD